MRLGTGRGRAGRVGGVRAGLGAGKDPGGELVGRAEQHLHDADRADDAEDRERDVAGEAAEHGRALAR